MYVSEMRARRKQHSGETLSMRKWVHFWQPQAISRAKISSKTWETTVTKKNETFIEIC